MFSHPARRIGLAAAATVLASLALPTLAAGQPPYFQTTVSISPTSRGGPSMDVIDYGHNPRATVVDLGPGGNTFEVTEGGQPMTAVAPCVQAGPDTARCPVAGIRKIFVNAAQGSDTIQITPAIPAQIRTVLVGGIGADVIEGGVGNDWVVGGYGDDRMFGNAGNDTLRGEYHADVIRGGLGNDWIAGGGGGDQMIGGAGIDTVRYLCPAGRGHLCEKGIKVVIGGAGFNSGGATDGPPGSRDQVTASVENVTGLRGRRTQFGIAGGRNILIGSTGPNVLIGGLKSDTLRGKGGNDRLLGRRGPDRLFGGNGRDRLLGGPGRDRLFGGKGRDLLLGGPGFDRCAGGPGRDRLRSC